MRSSEIVAALYSMAKATRKRSSSRRGKRLRKTKKVYGADRFVPYQIHKITLISFDPLKTCQLMKKIFGSALGKIESPPDTELKRRGIKWVRFLTGGKAELHFVPPFNLQYTKALKKLVSEQDKRNPLETEMFENHVGLYVPSLTPVVMNTIKHNIPYIMNRREDGLYQLYIDIVGSTDYLEVDSLDFDFKKVHNKYPYFRIMGFSDNTRVVKSIMSDRKAKASTHAYIDPKHDGAPRMVHVHRDGKVKVVGRDAPGAKKWTVSGQLDSKGNTIFDFSSKGGPKKIKAHVEQEQIRFEDGNVWRRDDLKLYNLV